MLVRLVLLGLRVYERAVARMESEIDGGQELVSRTANFFEKFFRIPTVVGEEYISW